MQATTLEELNDLLTNQQYCTGFSDSGKVPPKKPKIAAGKSKIFNAESAKKHELDSACAIVTKSIMGLVEKNVEMSEDVFHKYLAKLFGKNHIKDVMGYTYVYLDCLQETLHRPVFEMFLKKFTIPENVINALYLAPMGQFVFEILLNNNYVFSGAFLEKLMTAIRGDPLQIFLIEHAVKNTTENLHRAIDVANYTLTLRILQTGVETNNSTIARLMFRNYNDEALTLVKNKEVVTDEIFMFACQFACEPVIMYCLNNKLIPTTAHYNMLFHRIMAYKTFKKYSQSKNRYNEDDLTVSQNEEIQKYNNTGIFTKSAFQTYMSNYNTRVGDKLSGLIDSFIQFGYKFTYDDLLTSINAGVLIKDVDRFDIKYDEKYLDTCASNAFFPDYPSAPALDIRCLEGVCLKDITTVKEFMKKHKYLLPNSNCLKNACSVPQNKTVIKFLMKKGAKLTPHCLDAFVKNTKLKFLHELSEQLVKDYEEEKANNIKLVSYVDEIAKVIDNTKTVKVDKNNKSNKYNKQPKKIIVKPRRQVVMKKGDYTEKAD